MNNKKAFSKLLQDLTSISPRRGENEEKAFKIIINYLKESNLDYKVQSFEVEIPEFFNTYLIADKKDIPCIGCSFNSGKFTNDSPLLSIYGAKSDVPAILFNPISEGISLQSHKEFPSVSINKDYVIDILLAKEVKGEVNVKNGKYVSNNIVIGNYTNPRKIVFAHYDSIVGSGAIDNAGSVDVVIKTIIENKNLLNDYLFVLAGAEEESFSAKDSCYGFEVFDKEYKKIMSQANEIIVLDGVGVSIPTFTTDNLDWVFNVSRLDLLKDKIHWMGNDEKIIIKYSHSELDTLDKLVPKYLEMAKDLLRSKLRY